MAARKKVNWLERNVFVLPFWTVCFSQKDFDDVGKRLGGLPDDGPLAYISPEADATTHILDMRRSNGGHDRAAILCIPYEESPDAGWIALATHEAWHVVGTMKEMYPGTEWCEEQECVMVQSVVCRILDALSTEIGKRNPKKRAKKK